MSSTRAGRQERNGGPPGKERDAESGLDNFGARQLDQKKTPTGTSEINDKSLSMFGNAAHTVADGTSPAHVDAQGNPLPWNPYSPSAVKAHEAAESTITPEQMDNAVREVQQAFQDTYGQAAAQQAATPPTPPNDAQDLGSTCHDMNKCVEATPVVHKN